MLRKIDFAAKLHVCVASTRTGLYLPNNLNVAWLWNCMFMYTPECTHIIYNSVVIYKSILRHLNLCELDLVDRCIVGTIPQYRAMELHVLEV